MNCHWVSLQAKCSLSAMLRTLASILLLEYLLYRFRSLHLISIPPKHHRHPSNQQQKGGNLTSMNVSKSLSKFAKSSFLFLLSAIKPCFFLSNSCRCCSSASRSASSWFMRANMRVFSSEAAWEGSLVRNSATGIRGSCWYLWLGEGGC